MIGKLVEKVVGTKNERELKRLRPIVVRINELEPAIQKLSDTELCVKTKEFKERFERGESLDELLPEAFAVVREASRRVLGMRHFDVQIMGGIVLHEGKIAEMKTGEGKTLVATLPVYLNALTGKGVHVVTVNEYLAKRDAEWMGGVYRFLGLSVGVTLQGMSKEEKRKAYACDVTYGTNSEFGFDYLRDNMVYSLSDVVQRGHHYAIVDEVDSILIDEARTPLIISGDTQTNPGIYVDVDRLARKLEKGTHFEVDEKERTVVLTEEGIKYLERILNLENIFYPGNAPLLHLVRQALRAHYLMKKDVDYVVKGGRVVIVDEFTGRLMPTRRWSDGLHQAVEAKEGLRIGRDNRVLASITYQNYFRMYEKLAGMTGTAATEEKEFKEIYGMDVVVIPTHKPVIRKDHPDVVYVREQVKFKRVVEEVEKRHKKGQPVLVGTVSVEKSEKLSGMLSERGIPHVVLNAKNHEKEAEIIAQAGRPGAVTVATNMAGRGVDIILGGHPEKLARRAVEEKIGHFDIDEKEWKRAFRIAIEGGDPASELQTGWARILKEEIENWKRDRETVLSLGGLCVIGTERHESRRIDNQLRGRAGRQGDPGESRFYVSFEDDLIKFFGGSEVLKNLAEKLNVGDNPLESEAISQAIEKAQMKVEEKNFEIRKELLKYDNVVNEQRKHFYEHRSNVLKLIYEADRKAKISFLLEQIESFLRSEVEKIVSVTDNPEKGIKVFVAKNPFIKNLEITDHVIESIPFSPGTEFFEEEFWKRVFAVTEEKLSSLSEEKLNEALNLYLNLADRYWSEHLTALEHLKGSAALRTYAHLDPLVEYKKEAHLAFKNLFLRLSGDTTEFCTLLLSDSEINAGDFLKTRFNVGEFTGFYGPCPCGSGKKYRECCGRPNKKILKSKIKTALKKVKNKGRARQIVNSTI